MRLLSWGGVVLGFLADGLGTLAVACLLAAGVAVDPPVLRRHRQGQHLLEAAAMIAAAAVVATVAGSDAGQARAAGRSDSRQRPAFALGGVQERQGVRSSLLARPSRCAVARGPASYPWPLKPFDRQHPIRAFFGDPRTVFRGAADADLGAFSFHNGVDIVAADGTSVYPVLTGTVSKVKPDEIIVTSDAGARTFQYWHLESLVRLHQRVRSEKTVLGTVQPGRGHVHLTEIDGSVVENPLQPGHLTPYRDRTVPSVEELYVRDRLGRTLNPETLTGWVELTAAALDTPPLPLPAPWTGVPVTPARVSWQLSTPNGVELLPEQTPADFSATTPPTREFWSVYGDGTYQNFPAVGHRYFYGTPGDYLFNLTPTPLDTRLLPPGRYRLSVVAADTCGNQGTLGEQIRVLPQPGEPPLAATILDKLASQGLAARLSWPRRFWSVVIARLPARGGLLAAHAVAVRALDAHFLPVGILSTSTARTRRTGRYLVVTGAFHTWALAYTASQRAARGFAGAYPREIMQRRLPRLGGLAQSEGGRYTVVLVSVAVRLGQALARTISVAATSRGLPSVRLVRSARFTSMRPGYIVVVSGRYRTARTAAHAARLDATLYHHAYAREPIAKSAAPFRVSARRLRALEPARRRR